MNTFGGSLREFEAVSVLSHQLSELGIRQSINTAPNYGRTESLLIGGCGMMDRDGQLTIDKRNGGPVQMVRPNRVNVISSVIICQLTQYREWNPRLQNANWEYIVVSCANQSGWTVRAKEENDMDQIKWNASNEANLARHDSDNRWNNGSLTSANLQKSL